VIPHRGSAVVTIATRNIRATVHYESGWSANPKGDSLVDAKPVVTGYRDLDVRTCKTSSRLRAPSGPGPDGSDVRAEEQDRIGPVRFHPAEDATILMATNTVTGQTWRAATGATRIASVTAVPAARRVVLITVDNGLHVYDVDTKRVDQCP
jgi:hypothetical protein